MTFTTKNSTNTKRMVIKTNGQNPHFPGRVIEISAGNFEENDPLGKWATVWTFGKNGEYKHHITSTHFVVK